MSFTHLIQSIYDIEKFYNEMKHNFKETIDHLTTENDQQKLLLSSLQNSIDIFTKENNQQNNFNRLPSKKTTSGFRNVTKNGNNKWQVGLTISGIYNYFGSFEDVELADIVAQEARNKYHKQFKCDGVSK